MRFALRGLEEERKATASSLGCRTFVYFPVGYTRAEVLFEHVIVVSPALTQLLLDLVERLLPLSPVAIVAHFCCFIALFVQAS
jgi:hypothetical protein